MEPDIRRAYAIAAMQSILDREECNAIYRDQHGLWRLNHTGQDDRGHSERQIDSVAKVAFEVADAMIRAERQGTRQYV